MNDEIDSIVARITRTSNGYSKATRRDINIATEIYILEESSKYDEAKELEENYKNNK